MISILDYMIKKFVFIIKIAIYSVCKLINDNTCMCIWKTRVSVAYSMPSTST